VGEIIRKVTAFVLLGREEIMLEILTTYLNVVIVSNMGADLLLNERRILSQSMFVEMVVWRLSRPEEGSAHVLKYRLALVVSSFR